MLGNRLFDLIALETLFRHSPFVPADGPGGRSRWAGAPTLLPRVQVAASAAVDLGNLEMPRRPWRSVADAADGADGIFERPMYPDDPVAGTAFPTERNVIEDLSLS